MNPATFGDAKEVFSRIHKVALKYPDVRLLICPPSLYIMPLASLRTKERTLTLGAQDTDWRDEGAHTGNISSRMIKNAGAIGVIIGHSERRAEGEDDEIINKKIARALRENLMVVFCFGERERDDDGHYLRILREQITVGLMKIPQSALKNILFAYEPVWAIGKEGERAINPHVLHEMVIFVRKVISELYPSYQTAHVRILYGGSVSPENAGTLLKEGNVNGLLVGHKSLEIDDFTDIIITTHNHVAR